MQKDIFTISSDTLSIFATNNYNIYIEIRDITKIQSFYGQVDRKSWAPYPHHTVIFSWFFFGVVCHKIIGQRYSRGVEGMKNASF